MADQHQPNDSKGTQSDSQKQTDPPLWRSGVGRGEYKQPDAMYQKGQTVYVKVGRRGVDGPWTVESVNADGTYDIKNEAGKKKCNVKEEDLD